MKGQYGKDFAAAAVIRWMLRAHFFAFDRKEIRNRSDTLQMVAGVSSGDTSLNSEGMNH